MGTVKRGNGITKTELRKRNYGSGKKGKTRKKRVKCGKKGKTQKKGEMCFWPRYVNTGTCPLTLFWWSFNVKISYFTLDIWKLVYLTYTILINKTKLVTRSMKQSSYVVLNISNYNIFKCKPNSRKKWKWIGVKWAVIA